MVALLWGESHVPKPIIGMRREVLGMEREEVRVRGLSGKARLSEGLEEGWRCCGSGT